MICPICYCRFAEYPEKDFDFIKIHGIIIKIIAKNTEAEEKRAKAFNSINQAICEYCLEEEKS